MSYCVLIPDSQLLDIVWFGFASRIRLSQAGLRTEKGGQQTFIVFKSKSKENLQEETLFFPPPPRHKFGGTKTTRYGVEKT